MRRHRKNHFLTLVLTLMVAFSLEGFALPEANDPAKQISTSPVLKKSEQEKSTSTMQDSMSITPTTPPPIGLGENPLLPTRRLAKDASTAGMGLWMGPVTAFDASDNLLYLSLGQSKYIESQIAKELTFELTTNALFGGSYGYKWLQNLGSYYEPYFKVAVGGLFTTGENFGTFINWKRYQLRGSVGTDDLFSLGRRVRCEASMIYSGFGISLAVSGSYAF